MVMRQGPTIQQHSAEILTAQFQISGQIEVIGPLANHVNDATRGNLVVNDARLTPVTSAGLLQPYSCPRLLLRKSQVVLLYLSAAESRASIRPLPRRELLVAHTPVAVCRGYFHMTAESNVQEFIDLIPGEFLFVTEARIFPVVHLPSSFPSEAELILLRRSQLLLYHTP